MQDQSLDTFKDTLLSARAFSMPKLLACCEHYIAADPQQRFQPVSAHLGDVLHPSTVTRIADSLQVAIRRMGKQLETLQADLLEKTPCTQPLGVGG